MTEMFSDPHICYMKFLSSSFNYLWLYSRFSTVERPWVDSWGGGPVSRHGSHCAPLSSPFQVLCCPRFLFSSPLLCLLSSLELRNYFRTRPSTKILRCCKRGENLNGTPLSKICFARVVQIVSKLCRVFCY